MINLRRATPALLNGRVDAIEIDADAGWLAYRRGRVTVALNVGDEQALGIPVAGAGDLMASAEGVALHSDAIDLPPDSVAIVVGDQG